ncbi:baseplate multidomain protein megatron [Roseovarius sp. 2305UL8-3]|uniref:baseplate multidomain protein megatron n=1 Tax=Roseovarius conchicola TaxID=3121636 RepID=UPI0035286700
MATVLLSAAGAAIGGSVGGTVMGLSMAAAGRFAGAVIGKTIDQRLMGQGSDIVEQGRVERLRLTGAGEGDGMAQVFGKMRTSGQVIWATEFTENVTVSGGGGKGAPSAPKTATYDYSVSVAIALCEGEITHVGRVWADGDEIARDDLVMRVYRGTPDQQPDPKMEAVEGPGAVPAYRGTAYVVIEELALGQFGNRVPQFTFEVCRPSQPWQEGVELDPAFGVRGVAMLPGSGEYALATSLVTKVFGPGSVALANVNSPSAKSDFSTSLDQMTGELTGCESTSLVVSWFGDDLRAGECTLRPKVEQSEFDSSNMPWQVNGLNRQTALGVPRNVDDQPVYGGTPCDQSVIEAIEALIAAGQSVLYYPFILMDQLAGNGLGDPYSDAEDQPALPWRGRITTSKAPGQPGSPDGTAAAEAEVAAFFGTAVASDFQILGSGQNIGASVGFYDLAGFTGTQRISPVVYSGPEDDWGYRRFILHQAALCAAAGGVEAICIGSEMRGLTQIRGENNSFPAVAQLTDLASEVRQIVGPGVKISYAADWSEYFGYLPQDGSGDRFFHLDSLWADSNIDFIAIDNYMPLSDWRDEAGHADEAWGSIYNLDYLKSNIIGGEGYDWFYHSPEAREAQIRTPITDEEHNEPWVWRYKDVRSWWLNVHHERIGGVRQANSTAWVAQSKPIRFAEYGCAAIDKGTNQPNKFLDPKSSESQLPYFSNGRQDELMQRQYLRAMISYWTDPANNPVSEEYEGPMLEFNRSCVWAWDARPYPWFPNNRGLWSDGDNYGRGHWLTGRASARSLASVVDEICHRSGVTHYDVDTLYGHVRGYGIEDVSEGRSALQPLMLRYGFDAVDRAGMLTFRLRDGLLDQEIDPEWLVRDGENNAVVEETRASAVELAGRVRLRFVESNGDYEVIAEEAILPDETMQTVSVSELPISMTRAEGRQTVERWLSESRVARDTARLTLPPSMMSRGAGDVISLPEEGGRGLYRIDRTEQMGLSQKVEAVRIEPETYVPIDIGEIRSDVTAFGVPVPVTPLFLDLPLMTGQEVPHAPHVAVTADPWPGSAAVYSSSNDTNYFLNALVQVQTPIGVTETPLSPAPSGLYDRGAPVRVRMLNGQLESVEELAMLGGANLCAIGDGTPDGWELFQFQTAELVGARTYLLSHRLRGQAGTETAQTGEWPAGSLVVRLNGTPQQIDLKESELGLERFYRIGPGDRFYSDPSYQSVMQSFDGIGLRPYAPVHLRTRSTDTGDIEVSWVRRTRVDGDRWDRPEVPLGEESESYLVRVSQNSTVVREEIINQPFWTYGAAERAADGLAGFYQIEAAQISASFGTGPFTQVVLAA